MRLKIGPAGLGLALLMASVSCEVPVATLCEAGPCDDWGGFDGGAAADTALDDTTQYRWVIIVDNTVEDHMMGSAGVDICGAVALCEGTTVTGSEATVIFGEGMVCGQPDAVGEICATTPARNNPRAAADEGNCDDQDDESSYVSLGLEGVLAIDFNQDLRGCTVIVREDGNAGMEAYQVYICTKADAVPTLQSTDCIGGTSLGDQAGGEVQIPVPR
jgi:hypothetical protein